MERVVLKIRRLTARAFLPERQSEGAAGLDIAACLPEVQSGLKIEPGAIVLVPTGLAMAIPPGHEGQVRPRSGLAAKFGVTVVNAPGTIDSDYRGELRIALINLGREPCTITHGMRIAQLVIAPVSQITVEETAFLDDTERGHGGFGSTGLV